MTLNADAVGTTVGPRRVTWTEKDCRIYALGVGAGVDDLRFTTENTRSSPQEVLPTMPVVLGGDPEIFRRIGSFDWSKVVHAEQGVTTHAPLPTEGAAITTTRVEAMHDKGRAAVLVLVTDGVSAESEQPLFRTETSLFIRDAGGWGGDRGPRADDPVPDGPPDTTVTYETGRDQALLYRLSGDRNPLHSDPEFARRAGFDRPILHGLCTYGFTGRALLSTLADDDPARFRAMHARFARPVYPGDTLHVDIWRTAAGHATFRTRQQDDEVVLSHGRCELA